MGDTPQAALAVAVVAGGLVLVVASMAALHERHYRERRSRLVEARWAGLELRLQAVEQILAEDRLT